MRIGTSAAGQHVTHLLDWTCGTVKQVVRSTFTSETHGVIMTADYAIIVSTMLHGVVQGPVSPREAMRLTE